MGEFEVMITIFVCLYNYFIWLFTGHIPMEHLTINPLWIFGGVVELGLECSLLQAILEVVIKKK